jgi:hypothetical protein
MEIVLQSPALSPEATETCVGETDVEVIQFLSVELPVKWFGVPHVVILKCQQPVFDFCERLKIIRDQNLPLHDRKVDLDLIQPAGMQDGGQLSAGACPRNLEEDGQSSVFQSNGR